MKKNLVILSLLLAFSLVLSACANAASTQDAGQIASQVAAQVEAQVSTRVAQAMAAIDATQKAQPTTPPIIPTIEAFPTLAPVNASTISLPGVATNVPCNPPPNALGENYPDGTSIYINTAFTKKWTIQNAGTCTWNANYKLKFMDGDSMSGPASQSFGASVPPGGSLTLALPLKTPGTAGSYTGYWGLYDDKDVYFGRVWVTINSILVSPTSTSYAVTNVHIYEQGSDACTVYADITTNGIGTVKFYWTIDGNHVYPPALSFGGAGMKTVHTTITPTSATHTVYVYIDVPNRLNYGSGNPFPVC